MKFARSNSKAGLGSERGVVATRCGAGFEVVLTEDQNLEFQQNWSGLTFA